MAKPKTKQPPEAATPAPRMPHKQTTGPLSPSVPEVTVYLATKDGVFMATPSDMSHKGRKLGTLVTDDESCIDRFAHSEVVIVQEMPPRLALVETSLRLMHSPMDERVMIVAGSADLVAAAIDDAWKVVAQCPAADPAPYTISDWRVSRPKEAAVTTYTRG